MTDIRQNGITHRYQSRCSESQHGDQYLLRVSIHFKPTGRKKTYREVKVEKHAASIAAKLKESRQAKGYEMMGIGETMKDMRIEGEGG